MAAAAIVVSAPTAAAAAPRDDPRLHAIGPSSTHRQAPGFTTSRPTSASPAPGLPSSPAATTPQDGTASRARVDSGQPTPPPVTAICQTPDSRIGRITFDLREVFDPGRDRVSNWLATAANAIHVRTRESVVRRELLVREGDACDEEAIRQTERNLRALGLFRHVEVTGSPGPDRTTDLTVVARDAFTLRVSTDYSRQGGAHAWDVMLGETNVAGLGIAASVRRGHDFERDITSVALGFPRLLGSRERLAASLDRRSDGDSTRLSLARPFYTLATRWGHDLAFGDTRDQLRLYDAGEVVRQWTRHALDATAAVAVRLGRPSDSRAWRLSGGYHLSFRDYPGAADDAGDSAGAGGPADTGDPTTTVGDTTTGTSGPATDNGAPEPDPVARRHAGPFIALSRVTHVFEKRRGLVSPDHDLDLNLGLTSNVWLSVSPRTRTLRTDAQVRAGGAVSRGWRRPGGAIAVGRLSAAVEFRPSDGRRAEVGADLRAWWPQSPRSVRAALVEYRAVVNPDAGDRRYLGGTPGLRAYRQHAFAGTETLMAVVEQRRYLAWTPFGLVRPGAVVFVEAGVVSDRGLSSTASERRGRARAHADLGVGLRLALLGSAGGNIIRLDLAFPVERAAGRDRRPLVVVGYRGDF